MTTWVSTSTDQSLVAVLWPDAPLSDDATQALLDVAQVQCEAFAPTLADGVDTPANYKTACILQASALFKAGFTGGADQIGGDQPVRVFPMDWTVKALLRPQPGVPVVI